jgi:hypothetical protein
LWARPGVCPRVEHVKRVAVKHFVKLKEEKQFHRDILSYIMFLHRLKRCSKNFLRTSCNVIIARRNDESRSGF